MPSAETQHVHTGAVATYAELLVVLRDAGQRQIVGQLPLASHCQLSRCSGTPAVPVSFHPAARLLAGAAG